MQKNWYAVYTKQHCERKVAYILTKRKIENYCPLNYKNSRSIFRKTVSVEPIFNSYVFINTTEEEALSLSKEISGIISLLYWKGKPATIKEEDINTIKEFSSAHHDIRLEKMHTYAKNNKKDQVSYMIDGKLLMVKNAIMRKDLPSLGFTMVAEVEEQDVITGGISFPNNQLMVQ